MDSYGIFDPDVAPRPDYDQMEGRNGHDDDFFLYSLPIVPDSVVDSNVDSQGQDAVTLTFYEGPRKCKCCQNWVQKPPMQVPEVERNRFEKAAILLFKGKNHTSSNATIGGLIALEDSFVEIQSSTILRLIRPILAKQGFLAPKNKKVTIQSPFMELFHSYTDVVNLKKSLQPNSREDIHLQLIIKVMDDLFSDFAPEIRELHECRMISSEHLWTIFPKGMVVFTRRDGHDCLLRVLKIEGEHYWRGHRVRHWKLTCQYIQFDGIRFGWVDQVFYIDGFEGVQNILDLQVYPLGFHPDESLEQRIRDRGRAVIEYQGISQCEYAGKGVTRLQSTIDPDEGKDKDPELRRLTVRPIESFQVSGRVIVDAYGFKKFNSGIAPDVLSMDIPGVDDDGNEMCQPSTIEMSGRKRFEALEKGRLTTKEQELAREAFLQTPEHLLLLCPLLPGYSLRSNMWLWLSIDSLRPIKWNTTAMDMLVIPEKSKNLLSTFVRRHNSTGQISGDVINGKGQGFIVMLSGPPGTGKTLTAEVVSERAQRPLLRLQAETLGDHANDFGLNLARAFDLATEWGAIMLIDEADAVLGQRSTEHPDRNGLISVMLRQLEYYRGIMFLTTNLADQIDNAFRSRIQFHLCYTSLSVETRLRIWACYLKRIEEICERLKHPVGSTVVRPGQASSSLTYNVKPTEVESLALWNLNGREIKNVVKTVYQWCLYNGFEISLERLEDGIELTAPFAGKILEVDPESPQSTKRKRTD